MRPRPEGRGERVGAVVIGMESRPASMRPRPEGRGELARDRAGPTTGRPRFNAATARRPWRTLRRQADDAAAVGLQCGHDPKAVENSFRPAFPAPAMPPLQCGHSPKAVENRRASQSYKDVGRHFNAATTRRPWRTMGTYVYWDPTQSLQCGHDPKAVENEVGMRHTRRTELLQSGHDPKAVENPRGARRASSRAACFNAATTRRPWRTVVGGAATATEAPMASMRPRPEGRGERSRSRRRSASRCCFNAATARRPWRTDIPATRAAARRGRGLQCGHDPKAVENDCPRTQHVLIRRASMRPRPEGRGERRRWRPR